MSAPKTQMAPIRIWTVYDHPTDYPDKYVARLFEGDQATASIIIADSLETLRMILCFEMGLARLARFAGDDAKIVETWL